jgi:hypothetical protein
MRVLPGAVERFTDEMVCRKLKEVEAKPLQIFPKWIHEANVESIDLAVFSVKVLRKDGSEVGKNELSAGDT